MNAVEILQGGIDAMIDRAAERDKPDGERTMVRIIGAYEQLTGIRLTEVQGWLFMAVLKMARATAGKHRLDDYVDGAAYVSLAGEAAEREAAGRVTPCEFRTVPRPQCEGSVSAEQIRAAIVATRMSAAELDE